MNPLAPSPSTQAAVTGTAPSASEYQPGAGGASLVEGLGGMRAAGLSAACLPNAGIVARAEQNRQANDKPPGYGRSWKQLLVFFGEDWPGHEPVTLAEMDARVGRWGGWKPFRDEVARLLDCGWTPPTTIKVQQNPGTPEPQQSSAPTGYEAWVTQTHDQDYAANFRYDVPEGLYKTYDVTAHVQLTPADAAVDGVVVYLHAPAINNLLHSGALIGAGTTNTHIPASSTAWTHRGNGHYTRVVPVTFNSVDDDVVNSNYGLGNFEIHTIPRDRQTKRGALGSKVEFYHQEDDLTYPTIAKVTYTSTTTGTYAVVAGRQATAKLRVVATPSGSASVTPRGELWTDIPANTPQGTEINEQHNGGSLYFSCPGPGDGWLTLTPHWNTPAHIDPNYSHTVKVCPGRPVSGSKRSDYLTYKFHAGLNCKEIDRLNSSGAAGIFGWVDVLNEGPGGVCHANYEHVWEALGNQSFRLACTVMSGEGLPHGGLMSVTVNGNLLLSEDHPLRWQYKRGCYN